VTKRRSHGSAAVSTPALAPRRDARAWWVAAALIAVLAAALYANSLDGALLFDDVNAIVNNQWVRSGDLRGIVTRASWWGGGRGHGWRPLTTLTFAADHALHGLAPFGYHLVNVLLHAAVSVLVFAAFARATGTPRVAAIAALLFAAHPVHTEAVASVVGRAELLAAAGFFVAWLCFLRADDARALARGRRRLLEALGVVVFLAAALAKENALALVAVLVFADLLCAPAGAPTARLRAHAARYGALLAATLVFVVLRGRVLAGAPQTISILDNPLVALPPLARELTAIKVAGLYGWRLLVPWHLAADYSYRQLTPVTSALDPPFVLGAVLVVAIPLLTWRAWGRAPAAALGLGVLMLTFAMVSNFVFPIGTIMAERLLYLPSAGFCLAAAVVLERGARVPAMETRLAGLTVPRLAIPLAIVLALYALRTTTRNRVWRDRLTFFSTMVAQAPESARSQRELGAVLADRGRFDAARAAFERSLAIKPDDAATLYNLGNALLQEGRIDDAVAAYRRALAVKPDFADAMVNLGNAESLRGDHHAALEWLRRALVLTPDAPSLHMNVANELFRLGSYDEARAEYQAALALAPAAGNVLTNYGAFLLARGEAAAASDVYRRAGDVPMALVGLAASYRVLGRLADARAVQARAARLFPANAAVRQMGEVLERDTATGTGGG
jgi:Tfp pilus assembly protein PilF